jgi:hypothetical protein
MFRVLVLGGIALVGDSACGGSTAVQADAGAHDGAFPSETNASSEAGADADSVFPSELPSSVLGDASLGFPSEVPNYPDRDAARESGSDAGGLSDAPSERGSDAGNVSDAASEAKLEEADSATCVGVGCFPSELPQ